MPLQVGPLEIDFERQRVAATGVEVRLRPRCWDLLVTFARRPGDVISKEEIWAELWPDVAVEPNSLNVLIWDLRRSLAKAGVGNLIESVGRRGYRLRSEATDGAGEWFADVARPSDRVPTQLIGREAELEHLRARLDAAAKGSRQLVFVTGEAGIGKSFLINAFAEELTARQELRWARVSCLPLQSAEEVYGAILEAIEGLAADPSVVAALHRYAPAWLVQLPNLLPPKEMQRLRESLTGIGSGRLLREAVRLLEHLALRQPLAIIIEDIHWADDGTLDVLASLAARRQPANLLVLVSLRTYDLGERETRIRTNVYNLVRQYPGAARFDLQPFDRPTIARFVEAAYQRTTPLDPIVAVLEEASGGNPLFLATLAESLGQVSLDQIDAEILTYDIPQTLREVISERLDRLPGAVIPLIEAAAIVGVEFTAAEVAAALESDTAAVEGICGRMAQQKQFILSAGEQAWPDGTATGHYRFRHALYQRAVYERCATALRRTLHNRIGKRLGDGYRDQVPLVVARLNHHFEAAGNLEAIATYEEIGAGIAFGRYAMKEALLHFERVLRTLQRLPDSAQRLEREVRLQLDYANLGIWHEGFSSERARGALERAYHLTSTGPPTELFVRSQLGRCMCNWMTGSVDVALQIADEIVQLTRTVVPQLEAAGCFYAAIVRGSTDVGTALGYYERALVLSGDAGQAGLTVDLRAMILSGQATALVLADREPEALASAEAARAKMRSTGAPGPLTSIDAFCACAMMLAGAVEHTERIAGGALALTVENDITNYSNVLEICLAWARHVGTKQPLAELEQAVRRRAASSETWYQGVFELYLAECLLGTDKIEAAQRWLDSAAARDEPVVRAEVWRIRAALARQRGEIAAAAESLQRAVQIAEQQGAKIFARRAASALQSL